MSAPLNVTILPAEPGSGFVYAVERDPFDDDACSAVLDLGPIVAWRFETYADGLRCSTTRHPVGIEPEPPGDDWTVETSPDAATHREALAAIDEAVEQYDRRHTTTTEENPS